MDFGDGSAVSYVNLSSTEDGIRHIYQNVGIFRVTAQVENNLGADSAVLYLHVNCMLLLLVLTYILLRYISFVRSEALHFEKLGKQQGWLKCHVKSIILEHETEVFGGSSLGLCQLCFEDTGNSRLSSFIYDTFF